MRRQPSVPWGRSTAPIPQPWDQYLAVFFTCQVIPYRIMAAQFYEWLRYQRDREDRVGDFARDTFWDTDAPRGSDDPDVWRKYVAWRGVPFLRAGFEQSWAEFEESA